MLKELGVMSDFSIGDFGPLLDSIPSYVFVTKPDSFDIIYSNSIFKEHFSDNLKGSCYGRIKSFLANQSQQSGSSDGTFSGADFYCGVCDKWFQIYGKTISLPDYGEVRLYTMEDITDKIEYEKEMERHTLFDSVTGLPNRKQLDIDFQDVVRYAENDNQDGMMLFLDIDNFKIVNDRFGYQYGDILLKQIGSFLSTLNKFGAQSYAFGGDEFLILIPHLSVNNSGKIIETIISRFDDSWKLDDVMYTTSASIGSAMFPRDGSSLGSLLQKVDMSVYKAKSEGKSRLIEYRDTFGSKISRHMDVVKAMRESVLNDLEGFYVAYQPIVSAKTKQVESVEALMRWKHPELGNIGPNEFIPIAEDTGLILALGEFVLREGMTKCKQWVDKGYIRHLNINLSVNQMVCDNFIDTVKRIIDETGVDPNSIVFEITESIAIKDINAMNEKIAQLCDIGIRIALDDFGTGYSSLNCIKDLPLGIVKLDKKFIDNVSNNNLDKTVVMSVVDLSHKFDLSVCAEGVEYNEQYGVLKDMGVDLIQGYLFSKPQDTETLENEFFAITN